MLPFISDGEKVTFDTTRQAYEVGDIVLFTRQQMLVVHRIISKRKSDNIYYYKIKGDNVNCIDGDFCSDMILGVILSYGFNRPFSNRHKAFKAFISKLEYFVYRHSVTKRILGNGIMYIKSYIFSYS